MESEKVDLLKDLPVPIILVSKSGNIRYVNAEGLFLFAGSSYVGAHLSSFLSENSKELFNHFLETLLHAKTIQKCDVEFKRADEPSIPVTLKGKLATDENTIHITTQAITENNETPFSYKVKYEEIKTVANIGHWELNLKSNEWQYCSKIFEFYELDPNMTNVTPELFSTLIHPDDRDKVISAFTNSLQEKKIYEVDHRILLKQGKIKWIRETCHWIFDDLGNPIGAIGTSQEITKQIELEQKLRDTETNYYNMVENTSSLVWSCDRDGNFTYLNPAWTRVLGYDRSEMINHPYSEFQPIEFYQRNKEAYENFNESGKTVKFGYETIYLTKDGQKRYLEFYPTALFDTQGFVIGSHGTAIDLTDKRILDLKLEETYFELGQRQFAIDQHAIVAITNLVGDIIYVNRKFCEISQYNREELLGKNHRIINSGHHSPEFFRELYRTIKKGETWHGEIKNKAKDGSFYWVATTIAPIKNSKGEIEKYLSIRTDITQIKEADERIRLLLEEKALLLVEVHHRIKNNMNTIFSLLRMEANAQENSSQKNILIEASSRVRSMMLLYDKLYRSENTEAVSIGEYFPVLISEILNIFPNKEIINTIVEAEPALISSKMLSIIGIIINELITNSMKYSFVGKSSGEIKFFASLQNEKLILNYEDNGHAMDDLIDIHTTKSFGLNLIRILIQQLKGSIHLERKQGNSYIMEFKI